MTRCGICTAAETSRRRRPLARALGSDGSDHGALCVWVERAAWRRSSNESERRSRMPQGEGCAGSRSAICLGLGGLVAVTMLSAVALGPGSVGWLTTHDTGTVGPELTWKDYLAVVDEALARGDVSDAVRS